MVDPPRSVEYASGEKETGEILKVAVESGWQSEKVRAVVYTRWNPKGAEQHVNSELEREKKVLLSMLILSIYTAD